MDTATRIILIAILALATSLAAPTVTAAQASDAKSDGFAALQKEFSKEWNPFIKKVREAKDDSERSALIKNEDPRTRYAEKFLLYAQENQTAPEALEALTTVMELTDSSHTALRADALEILQNRFAHDQKLAPAVLLLRRSKDGEKAESFLSAVIKENPDKKIRGLASLTLAEYYSNNDQPSKAIDQFKSAIAEYSDIAITPKATVGEAAKTQLFELEHLAIGMEAPDIEGKDVDGKTFKLSDYKGRAVLVSFFGDW
ncbi:MAG TPA: hypothetical protein V6C72_18245 [Chroococcales cyanobacterium]